ncbi:MAG TPA: 2-oxoacid:acceptor oxidoreductase subunit alpha [Planctomycetota bacterium]|nr:2-oxoacid:acceptor oxidoreductase subunit alpha [Planctomycetota bacterium]
MTPRSPASAPAQAPAPAAAAPAARPANDFVIKVGTVNGTGSQTANMVLLRSLFRMGVSVSGKNVFPSNIQGLPTWFEIRLSPRGYQARRRGVDLLVAMNPETSAQDAAEVLPGGLVVHEAAFSVGTRREGIEYHAVPFGKLVAEVCPDARLRRLLANMLYVGVVARLLGIDREAVYAALEQMLGGKPKAVALNRGALDRAWKWADDSLPPSKVLRVERPAVDANAGKVLLDGNAAAALGAVFAGVSVFSWYPITPSTSVGDAVSSYLRRFRGDPAKNEATWAVIQAEDELAAIGMAVGAGWAGARSATATSGPGISLMTELVGFAYYAEIPVVVFDIQRLGPSTGLPTRTAQGDLLSVATLSHGDTRHPMLFPSSVAEAFRMGGDAFDLAERWQTPVFVMSDLDLGMNLWPSEPFPYPERPLDRGKVLSKEDLAKLGAGKFGRYEDVDGDGIPRRTLPGTPGGLGAYFTRGSGHDEKARYTEDSETFRRVADRLLRKWDTIRAGLPAPVVRAAARPSAAGILHFGTSAFAVEEALDLLRESRGVDLDSCRVLAWPFHDAVEAFLAAHERIYVVEQNRDGQMRRLLAGDYPAHAARLRGILHYDGWPLDAGTVADGVLGGEKGAK